MRDPGFALALHIPAQPEHPPVYTKPCLESGCTAARPLHLHIIFGLKTRYIHWMRQSWIYVYRFFHGRTSAQEKGR